MSTKNQNTTTLPEKRQHGLPSPREVVYTPIGSDKELRLSISMVQKFIAVPTRKGDMPPVDQTVQFMMLAAANRWNPWQKDCYMIPYWDSKQSQYVWNIIASASAFLKRAEVSPKYDGLESGIIVREKDGTERDIVGAVFDESSCTLVGGWAKVYIKDQRVPIHVRISLASREKTDSPFWTRDPAGQIEKCAIVAALRRAFPSALGSVYIAEEMPTKHVQAESTQASPDFASVDSLIDEHETKTQVTNEKPEPKPESKPKPRRKPRPKPKPEPAPEPPAPPEPEPPKEQPQPQPQHKSPWAETIEKACAEAGIPTSELDSYLAGLGFINEDQTFLDVLPTDRAQILSELPNLIADLGGSQQAPMDDPQQEPAAGKDDLFD